MINVRNYRNAATRTAPDFGCIAVGERRFFKHWSLRQIAYALEKHNAFFQTDIKIRCESVQGCSKTRVVPGVVVRRVR